MNYHIDLILGEAFCISNLSSFISQILNFVYEMICIFILDGVNVKTENVS